MDKGNYFLYKLSTYQCTFCDSDCLNLACQRNKDSETYAYFKKYKDIKFSDDFSPYCTRYRKPLVVVNHDVT